MHIFSTRPIIFMMDISVRGVSNYGNWTVSWRSLKYIQGWGAGDARTIWAHLKITGTILVAQLIKAPGPWGWAVDSAPLAWPGPTGTCIQVRLVAQRVLMSVASSFESLVMFELELNGDQPLTPWSMSQKLFCQDWWLNCRLYIIWLDSEHCSPRPTSDSDHWVSWVPQA